MKTSLTLHATSYTGQFFKTTTLNYCFIFFIKSKIL